VGEGEVGREWGQNGRTKEDFAAPQTLVAERRGDENAEDE